MKQNRIFAPLFCVATVLFTVALVYQLDGETETLQLQGEAGLAHNGSRDAANDAMAFEKIALKHGTDKVTTHGYQSMYEKYLSPLRDLPLKMLEIGLGCNMEYGPGASYYTWLEYLPHVELYFIEFDAPCASRYQDKTVGAHVFVGDQADAGFLERFAANTTVDGPFDIVIDDGGHTMEQQITSLEHLWRIVRPGGIYVIEDLQTSYWMEYGGDPSTRDPQKHTTMKYLYGILDELMAKDGTRPISQDLLSVECMAEICALRKKGQA